MSTSAAIGCPVWMRVVGGTGLFGKAGALRRQARGRAFDPGRLVYVGDELRDLEAARDARVRFAAVAWGYTPLERLAAAGPDFQCRHPRDLLSIDTGPGRGRLARPVPERGRRAFMPRPEATGTQAQ
jgi:hypothetical protein